MNEEQLQSIGEIVVETAQEIFEVCGAKSDFCIQSISVAGAVFGGTNRVIWRPRYGFRLDRLYCTQRFIKEFEAHYG